MHPCSRRTKGLAAFSAGVFAIGLSVAVSSPVSAADPGPHSITSCTISDGTTTNSVWSLPLDPSIAPGTGPELTMVPTPASGKKLYQQVGYRHKTTNEFIVQGSGTGFGDNAGYQPPADVAYWVVSQKFNESNTDYPASDWVFEFRYWATQGDDTNNQTSDTTGSPLCKISVSVNSGGGDGGGGSGLDIDPDRYLRRANGASALPNTL
ncbi:MAG: hypothetical protein ACKOI2_12410 [Actinomycetota bacterium]